MTSIKVISTHCSQDHGSSSLTSSSYCLHHHQYTMATQALVALGPDQSYFQSPGWTIYQDGLPPDMVEDLKKGKPVSVSISEDGSYLITVPSGAKKGEFQRCKSVTMSSLLELQILVITDHNNFWPDSLKEFLV